MTESVTALRKATNELAEKQMI